MFTYDLITCIEQDKARKFEQIQLPFNDLDIDPHNDNRMPISLGSNQYLIRRDDID